MDQNIHIYKVKSKQKQNILIDYQPIEDKERKIKTTWNSFTNRSQTDIGNDIGANGNRTEIEHFQMRLYRYMATPLKPPVLNSMFPEFNLSGI